MLREFAKADGTLLRVAPIGGGWYAGWLSKTLPVLTLQVVTAAWMSLEDSEVEAIREQEKQIEVCVWLAAR